MDESYPNPVMELAVFGDIPTSPSIVEGSVLVMAEVARRANSVTLRRLICENAFPEQRMAANAERRRQAINIAASAR